MRYSDKEYVKEQFFDIELDEFYEHMKKSMNKVSRREVLMLLKDSGLVELSRNVEHNVNENGRLITRISPVVILTESGMKHFYRVGTELNEQRER